MKFFVNNFGRVVPADDDLAIQLQKRGLREATNEEVETYKNHKAAANKIISRADAKDTVHYLTVRQSPDGYGMSRSILQDELRRIGVNLYENYGGQKIGLLYSYPYSVTQMQTDVRLIYTMFESDKLPADWPDALKEADQVLVPAKWCADVFKKAGVDTTVVPLGYNHRTFKYIERDVPVDKYEDFTFVHYNGFNIRKGFNELLEAFTREFSEHEPVKLIIKTTLEHPPISLPRSVYPKIEVIRGQVSEADLVAILGRGHCFVYPSRGEGFGITPLEAMATGMPAIVPNAHGISEYFNAQYMLEVKVSGKCPGLYNRFKGQDVGEMVVCDIDHLRKQMRYAFNHQKEMKELGKAASEYVKRFTYEKTAEQLAAIIKDWETREVIRRPESKVLKVDRI